MSPPATPASVPTAAPLHGLPTDRWRRLEVAFWLVAVAAFFVFPQHRVIGNLILITGLFAVSLDLILGYAGIVSLGHAAYFGMGAYVAGILAARGWGEPLSGLLAAGFGGAILGYATSFLVVRGSDLARLMVTLGIGLMLYEAANQLSSLTGGADGLSGVTMWKILGTFSFDLAGSTAYVYSLVAVLAPGLFPPEFHMHGGTVGRYFEAAAVIVVLVLVGQVLELKAR